MDVVCASGVAYLVFRMPEVIWYDGRIDELGAYACMERGKITDG
jgi:hypothetical protein